MPLLLDGNLLRLAHLPPRHVLVEGCLHKTRQKQCEEGDARMGEFPKSSMRLTDSIVLEILVRDEDKVLSNPCLMAAAPDDLVLENLFGDLRPTTPEVAGREGRSDD